MRETNCSASQIQRQLQVVGRGGGRSEAGVYQADDDLVRPLVPEGDARHRYERARISVGHQPSAIGRRLDALVGIGLRGSRRTTTWHEDCSVVFTSLQG